MLIKIPSTSERYNYQTNMIPQFDQQYWTQQLKREIGLEHVSDSELTEHFVDFGSFFDESSNKKNAKQYIQEQLENIKQQYESIDLGGSIFQQNKNEFNSIDENAVSCKLFDVALSLDSVDMEPVVLDNISQLEFVPQTIDRESVKYFEVFVGNNTFVVAVNTGAGDFRTIDHINHIKSTSFFVEERNPLTFIGTENIISYYQFVNLIQPHLKPKNDFSAFEKISNNVETTFDGPKLEGF